MWTFQQNKKNKNFEEIIEKLRSFELKIDEAHIIYKKGEVKHVCIDYFIDNKYAKV